MTASLVESCGRLMRTNQVLPRLGMGMGMGLGMGMGMGRLNPTQKKAVWLKT